MKTFFCMGLLSVRILRRSRAAGGFAGCQYPYPVDVTVSVFGVIDDIEPGSQGVWYLDQVFLIPYRCSGRQFAHFAVDLDRWVEQKRHGSALGILREWAIQGVGGQGDEGKKQAGHQISNSHVSSAMARRR